MRGVWEGAQITLLDMSVPILSLHLSFDFKSDGGEY